MHWKHLKECITKIYKKMSYRYFPIGFSSYEDYVKYLKEKGLAIAVTEENNFYKNLNYVEE